MEPTTEVEQLQRVISLQAAELLAERNRVAALTRELEAVSSQLTRLRFKAAMPIHFMERLWERLPRVIHDVLTPPGEREKIEAVVLQHMPFDFVREPELGLVATVDFHFQREDEGSDTPTRIGLAVVPVNDCGRSFFTSAPYVRRGTTESGQ